MIDAKFIDGMLNPKWSYEPISKQKDLSSMASGRFFETPIEGVVNGKRLHRPGTAIDFNPQHYNDKLVSRDSQTRVHDNWDRQSFIESSSAVIRGDEYNAKPLPKRKDF